MTSATVHIIDDDASICRAVTRLLRSHHYTVLSYPSAARFLSQKLCETPACLILDLKMPDITGLDLQQILLQRTSCLPVIFVSGQADIGTSVRAMKAGAMDFLTKPFDDQELLSAVQAALARSKKALEKLEEHKKDQKTFVSLTPREQQVCIRIAEGLLNKQVGFELGTTEKTVKAQRARVMQKVGAGSLPDIVRFVERLRITGTLPSTANSRHI